MRHCLAVTLGALVVNFAIVSAVPAQLSQDSKRIEKVRRTVNKIGLDERVNVKFINGSRLKGRIAVIAGEHFVIADLKTGDSTTISFAQVEKVRKVEDGPFSEPTTIMAMALIPLIVGVCFWAARQD